MKRRVRTRPASFYWASGHVQEKSDPAEELRKELAFSQRCLETLRADNKASSECISALRRQLDMRNSEVALAREERDHARRRRVEAEASLAAVSSELREVREREAALTAECDALQRRNAELQRENQGLKHRLNVRNGKESPFGEGGAPSMNRPFRANSPQEKQDRKGGARQGHEGHGRRRFAESGVEVKQEACLDTSVHAPCCKDMALSKIGERVREYDRYIPARTEHVVSRLGIFKCRACGKVVYARPADVLKRMSYSNTFLAAGAVRHYVHGHTAGDVERELGVGEGAFFSMMDTVAARLLPAFEEIRLETARQFNVHVDETSWWTDGVKGYSWVFHNRNVELHLFPGTRSSSVPAEFFGYAEGKAPARTASAKEDGERADAPFHRPTPLEECRACDGRTIVSSDRFSGYSPLDVRHQYCFEHLKRDLKKLLASSEEKGKPPDEVTRFHDALLPLLAESMRLCADKAIPDGEYYGKAREIKERIRKIVFAEARDPGVRGYQDIWREKWESLFEWVEDRRVKCDNNAAERAIRPTVVARKISMGSQGRNGARNREIITSVLMTVRIRGGDPYQWLVDVLDMLARNPDADVAAALPEPDTTLRKRRREPPKASQSQSA